MLQHHERLDGSGYPRGIKAPEILIESRMMTIADIFDRQGEEPDPGAFLGGAGYHGRKSLTNSRFKEKSRGGLGHLSLHFGDDILFLGAVLCQRIQLIQTVGYRPFLDGSLSCRPELPSRGAAMGEPRGVSPGAVARDCFNENRLHIAVPFEHRGHFYQHPS